MFITPCSLIAITNTPIFQLFTILKLFLVHVIVKCRSEGSVAWVLREEHAQAELEVHWEECLREKGDQKTQSKSSDWGVELTPVEGGGEEGGVAWRRLGRGAALSLSQTKGAQRLPVVESRVGRAGSSIGVAYSPRYCLLSACEAAILVIIPLKQWCPSRTATASRSWEFPLSHYGWKREHRAHMEWF